MSMDKLGHIRPALHSSSQDRTSAGNIGPAKRVCAYRVASCGGGFMCIGEGLVLSEAIGSLIKRWRPGGEEIVNDGAGGNETSETA